MAVVNNPVVVMKRYEMKYILTPEQTQYFKESVLDHMKIDQFGLTSIASLYYDTPDYRLIRTSLEKPPFKEKIRLRSYGLATRESPVYLELKRKAYGIVYKRRVQSTTPPARGTQPPTRPVPAPRQVTGMRLAEQIFMISDTSSVDSTSTATSG